MKKFKIIAITLLVFALLFGIVGCASDGGTSTASGSTYETEPPLQPADHGGRFESLGANGCYGCHGNGEMANPILESAKAMPENHYLDGSYDSMETDPDRAQCNTCHPNS